MMSTGASDDVSLAQLSMIVGKMLVSKNYVIRMIFLNHLVVALTVLLVAVLAGQHLNSICGFLKVWEMYSMCINVESISHAWCTEGQDNLLLFDQGSTFHPVVEDIHQ